MTPSLLSGFLTRWYCQKGWFQARKGTWKLSWMVCQGLGLCAVQAQGMLPVLPDESTVWHFL